MTNKRNLFADLRRALDGLAYANVGEYLPLRDKEALLGAADPTRSAAPAAVRSAQPQRRVALAVQGQVQPGALRYARNACERLDADLDILTSLPEGGLRAVIDPERHSLAEAGRRVEIIRLGRDILRGVVHYARSRSGLLFVVVSAEDAFAERVIAGFSDSRHLDVPWVVVAGANAA
jgi:hypothetical protein